MLIGPLSRLCSRYILLLYSYKQQWFSHTVEMITKRPLFPGDCEIDELYKIFQYAVDLFVVFVFRICIHQLIPFYRILGTPTERTWPGVTKLQYYNAKFPRWAKVSFKKVIPNLSDEAEDLIEVRLTFIDSSYTLFIFLFLISSNVLLIKRFF